MASFQKKYGYERHVINHNKRQDVPKTKYAGTKDVSVTIEFSLLVYMLTIFYWCKYTVMSNMQCVVGIFILFVLATIANVIKENIK
jgi:hypothetical protein